MPELIKPAMPLTAPVDDERRTVDGKTCVRVVVRGKATWCPLSADGEKCYAPAASWAADVTLADGRRKRMTFSRNKDAAARMLADVLAKIE